MTSCVFIILQCNNILDHNSLRGGGGGQDLVRANSTAMGAISRRNLKFLSLSLCHINNQSINQSTDKQKIKEEQREREKKIFFLLFLAVREEEEKKLSPLN